MIYDIWAYKPYGSTASRWYNRIKTNHNEVVHQGYVTYVLKTLISPVIILFDQNINQADKIETTQALCYRLFAGNPPVSKGQ